jgi:hypothetical protein
MDARGSREVGMCLRGVFWRWMAMNRAQVAAMSPAAGVDTKEVTTQEAFVIALKSAFDHGFNIGFEAGTKNGIDAMEFIQEMEEGGVEPAK